MALRCLLSIKGVIFTFAFLIDLLINRVFYTYENRPNSLCKYGTWR